ncbi:MAG: TIR domain-containing protein [Clostridia bacterium]|nr:TIR domain-containing protein [Clostridia bacterium]
MLDYQVFISYRRDGGEYLAGRISDKLREHGYSVFYDVESMRSGKFNEQLLDAIDMSEDFLLILPPNGLDRCKDADDWVRQEIVHAIKNHKNIIPVMMRGFAFPDTLPEEIDDIRIYEGVMASSDYFDAVISKIESLLLSKKNAVSLSSQMIAVDNFIKSGLYSQAQNLLQQSLLSDPSNDKVYFYLAVCILNGKRPFLLQKNIIEQAISYLTGAVSMNPDPLYYYFIAYLKYDFYSLKFLRTDPDYTSFYNMAYNHGITNEQIHNLFSLLKAEKPAIF